MEKQKYTPELFEKMWNAREKERAKTRPKTRATFAKWWKLCNVSGLSMAAHSLAQSAYKLAINNAAIKLEQMGQPDEVVQAIRRLK